MPFPVLVTIILIAASIGLQLVSSLIAARKKSGGVEPGRFDQPKIAENEEIPIIIGQVKQDNPLLASFFDTGTRRIRQKGQTVGFKYFAGFIFVGCFGGANLKTIYIDDREIRRYPGSGTTTDGFQIINKNFYQDSTNSKNSDLANGIFLNGYYQSGNGALHRNENLETYLNRVILGNGSLRDFPDHRFISYTVFFGLSRNLSNGTEIGYIGNSPNIPRFSFEYRFIPGTLGFPGIPDPNTSEGLDANPIDILLHVYQSPLIGFRLNETFYDLESFTQAALTLNEENFGLSILIDKPISLPDLEELISKHIDAAIFTDLKTNKRKIKLIRNDYDIDDLFIIDSSIITDASFTDFGGDVGIDALNTSFTVNYIDRAKNYKKRSVTAVNSAILALNGNVEKNSSEDYLLCYSESLALRIADRELKTSGRALRRGKIKCNAKAFNLNPGDPFILNFPKYGINGRVFRVVAPKFTGEAIQEVEFEIVQDVFDFDNAPLFNTPGTDVPISTFFPALPSFTNIIFETPHFFTRSDNAKVSATCVRPNDKHTSFGISYSVDSGVNYLPSATGGTHSPSGLLEFDLSDRVPPNQSSFLKLSVNPDLSRIDSATSLEVREGQNIILIENELLTYESILVEGSIVTLTNVKHGAYDTVPTFHPRNTPVYFIDDFATIDEETFILDDSVTLKYLTQSTSESLDPDLASTAELTILNRAFKPYPPGGVLVNGIYRGYFSSLLEDEIEWVTKSRLDLEVTSQSTPALIPETVTYTVRVYDDFGRLLREVTGLTGLSFTYTIEDRFEDFTNFVTFLEFEIFSVRGTTRSLFSQRIKVYDVSA